MVAALILLLAAPTNAGAATIRLSPPVPSPAVGTEWDVQIVVERAFGENRSAEPPTLTIVNTSSHERESVVAEPTDDPDVYDAQVEFGSPGEWTYAVTYGDTTVTGEEPIEIAADGDSGAGSGWMLLALVAGAVAVAALAGLLALLLRRTPAPPPPPPRPAAPPPAAQPAAPPPDLVRDREALIGSCVYLYDIVRDETLRDRLRQALAEAGVAELDSVGARFDPERHRATGWVPTNDPALDGRIAEVERQGFSDRGTVFRLPEVVVYSSGERGRG